MIKDAALNSKPWWSPRIVPPQQAPNVLLILTDDAGFGVPSTFSGVIPTPAMDRAALITGRNHHSAGFGVISEQSTGFHGYNRIIERDKATIGRLLKDNGYSTAWFGKDHNVPAFQASRCHPCPAPPHQGVGGPDPRHASV